MKKISFAILLIAVIATFAGYHIFQDQRAETMSDLMMANVEALAIGENSPGDTGPGEIVDCAGWNTGPRKECMCRFKAPCTPTPCR